MTPAPRLQNGVARFVAVYTAAFAVYCAAAGERRVIAYMIVLGVAASVAVATHRVARFTPTVQWALAVSGLLHLIGGLLPSPQPGSPIFYETWLVDGVAKYDQVVHLAVSAVLTVAAWQLVGRWVDEARCPHGVRAFLAGAIAVTAGAANELFEFLSALRFDDAYVGGFVNIGWDLVFNAFGVLGAAVWLTMTAASTRTAASSAASEALRRPSRPGPSTAA